MTDDAEQARREASDWFILLREDPEDAVLRARFEAWRAADPLNAAAWHSINETFAIIGAATPAHAAYWTEPGGYGSTTGASVTPIGRHRRRITALAGSLAGAAIAACLLLTVPGPALWLRFEADHLTGAGALRSVRLADGTMVQLGPDSAIKLAGGADGREIQLLSGEAWFAVRHDPAHPFRVQAGTVSVTDIGTQFDVRRQGDDTVAVSVGQGEVRVADSAAPDGAAHDLHAGDWLRVDADHEVETGTEAADLAGLWRQGKLQVRGATVAAAIAEIRPWFAGTIVLTDGELGRQRVTGLYDLHDPAAALRALVSAHDGVVRRFTPWLLVVSGH